MKNFIKTILSLLLLSTALTSCKKENKVYELTFSASHNVTQENQFCNPYGYYSWSVEDKNYNSKYDESGYVVRETKKGTATATKGDWVYIYISVNDVSFAIRSLIYSQPLNEVLNISTGVALSVSDVVMIFHKLGYIFDLVIEETVGENVKSSLVLDCSLLSQIINWHPKLLNDEIKALLDVAY